MKYTVARTRQEKESTDCRVIVLRCGLCENTDNRELVCERRKDERNAGAAHYVVLCTSVSRVVSFLDT